jgi:hypothetical protein
MFPKDATEKKSETSYEQQLGKGEDSQVTADSKDKSSSDLPDVQKSQICLVEEHKPELSYQILVKTLADGLPGLCITRVYPAILGQRFDLENCTMIWLSTAGEDDSIRPRDLERLSLLLEQFFSNQKGAVLLDGIEYLITNNDFVTVLRLIQSIRDLVAMNEAIMIISLNPSTLAYQELSLLEREMDLVVRFHPHEDTIQQDFHSR